MKKGVFWIGLILATILNVIVFFYDRFFIELVKIIRNAQFDYFFLSLTFASNVFIIFFFLTTLFLWKEHKRRWILPLWLAGLLSTLISYVLKVLIHRPRPFQVELISVLKIAFHFMRNNFNTWNFSFPSFQAMFVFAAIPILNKEFRKFRYIWVIFAVLVAFSRVYFGVHYMSDIFAGAIMGYLIGYLLMGVEEKTEISKNLLKKMGLSN